MNNREMHIRKLERRFLGTKRKGELRTRNSSTLSCSATQIMPGRILTRVARLLRPRSSFGSSRDLRRGTPQSRTANKRRTK